MYIGHFSLRDLEQIIEVHLSRMLAGDMFVGWLVVLGLAALWDSISVYIGPCSREREKEKKG